MEYFRYDSDLNADLPCHLEGKVWRWTGLKGLELFLDRSQRMLEFTGIVGAGRGETSETSNPSIFVGKVGELPTLHPAVAPAAATATTAAAAPKVTWLEGLLESTGYPFHRSFSMESWSWKVFRAVVMHYPSCRYLKRLNTIDAFRLFGNWVMLWRVRLVNLDVSNAFAFALIVRFVPGQAVESIFNLILRIRNVPIKLQRVIWHHSLPNCNSPFSKQIWVVWRTNSPSRVVWVRSSKSKRWSQRPCQMWRLRSGFCGAKRRIGSNENWKIGSWTNGFYPFEHLFSTYWWSQSFSWGLTWEQRETTFQCCRKPCHHHPDGHPRRRPCRTLPMRVLAGGLKIKRKPTMMVSLCQWCFFPLWWSFFYDGKTIFVPPLLKVIRTFF